MNRPFDIGDVVILDEGYGGKLGNTTHIVQLCYQHSSCESGWMVKVSGYPAPLDSNWFTLKEKNDDRKSEDPSSKPKNKGRLSEMF